MPSYLWSGKDSSGREVTERIVADNPEQARDRLLKRGWTDPQLRTSEIHEFVKQQIEAVSDPGLRPNLTPKEELAFLQGTAQGFWFNWWKNVRESSGTFLIVGLGLAWSIYRHRFWGAIICGSLFVILAFLFPALHFWFGRTAELFHKLHEARNWRRWNQVFGYLEALERAQRSRKMGIGETETARYRALALAGSGKLEEAIDHFTKAADKANMPRWLFHSHLATIYTVAGKYNEALECYRQALEVATEKGIVCIDYGAYLVQRFNRPAEARELLAVAESTPLPDLAANHLSALRGGICVREGDFAAAKTHFEKALAGLEKQPKARYFAFEPSILLAHGYLALVNAALGEKPAAQAHFAKSEQYLATIRMDELIESYHCQMGGGAMAPFPSAR